MGQEKNKGAMFFLQFDATPRQEARIAREAAGAVINCWIDRPTLDEAISVARSFIREQGWIVDEYDEACEVNAQTYPPGKSGRDYFEQALIDKEVFVFYSYPLSDDH